MTEAIEVAGADDGSELGKFLRGHRSAKYGRFLFAILGAIPWVGAVFAASAA